LGLSRLYLGHLDEAIDLLRKARAANPRVSVVHLCLAGALGFRGNVDEARAALAEAIKLKPELDSLARWRMYRPWETNPQHWALREKTLNVGLRRAGFPNEPPKPGRGGRRHSHPDRGPHRRTRRQQ
jgi:adenylate cyclase